MTVRPFVDRPMIDGARADEVARSAAASWDLAPPVPLRRGMNALYRCGATVLRIGHATADPKLSHDLVDALRAQGIPTIAPRTGWTAVLGDEAVSAWEHVEQVERPIEWAAVGAAVRRVHDTPVGVVPEGYPVPDPTGFPWWDFERLLDEVGPDLEPVAGAGMRRTVDESAWALNSLDAAPVLCHGDVHPGNVMMTADGVLLIDWDLLCHADAAWDHAMLTTYAARWGGATGAYASFAVGYGRSLADDASTRALGSLRNVAATLMRVRAGRTDADAAAEAERRLRFWRGDADAPPWRAQ